MDKGRRTAFLARGYDSYDLAGSIAIRAQELKSFDRGADLHIDERKTSSCATIASPHNNLLVSFASALSANDGRRLRGCMLIILAEE